MLLLILVGSTNMVKAQEASFYGDYFEGRPTASGEIFDPKLLTAAHKTLPFGTIVQVRNIKNGKTVMVKINDRGPFVEERDIDLSEAAAEEIAMIDDGVAKVELTIIT
jgi:rare lipoprotein A